jgi:hypothetical protein
MIPNTASGASISISQSSIPSMVPVATTAPLQLPQRAQQNHVNQVIESAEIEILPPPSYDVAAGTPSATNLNFPSSVSNSFNTTLSSAVGPVTPPPNNRPWYPPEKGRPYSHRTYANFDILKGVLMSIFDTQLSQPFRNRPDHHLKPGQAQVELLLLQTLRPYMCNRES